MENYAAPTTQQRAQEIGLAGLPGEQFLAANDALVKTAQQAVHPFSFRISPTAQGVQVSGDEPAVMIASRIIEQIVQATGGNKIADAALLDATVSKVKANTLKLDLAFRLPGLTHPVVPMSLNQVAFMQTLLSPGQQLILGVGPTGTGKTHLAIAAALNHLAEERVKHIVITKPHVMMEGEVATPASRLELENDSQFDFFEDILRDLIGYQPFNQLVEQRQLELLPLGHMRGRTFNDAFVIVDEAQNMSVRKMRMAVTRIGRASRMVVTGDPTHVDLRGDETSGLAHLIGLLQGTDIAKIHHFENSQIIRNSLVARLEELYAGQREPSAAFAA